MAYMIIRYASNQGGPTDIEYFCKTGTWELEPDNVLWYFDEAQVHKVAKAKFGRVVAVRRT